MAKPIKYNIPGYGYLTAVICPHTEALYNLLANYHHEQRLFNSDQLGILRKVYPGAHHTRYEYLFLQWALLSELVKYKKSSQTDYGLGSDTKGFPCMPGIEKLPSGADIIQSLMLLANVGHLPDTFTTSRAVLQLLTDNQVLRRVFRAGLKGDDKQVFDIIVKEYRVFDFQYLMMLFLLHRYANIPSDLEGQNYPFQVIRSYYLNRDEKDNRLNKLWGIYRAIRLVAYLALDSHYTPVPFSIDLTSIISNFSESYNEIFDRQSSFQKALLQLNDVISTNIYMSSEALLQTSSVAEKVYKRLMEASSDNKGSITWLKNMFKPPRLDLSTVESESIEQILRNSYRNKDWDNNYLAHFEFNLDGLQNEKSIGNLIRMEYIEQNRVGRSFCRVAIHLDPTRKVLSIVYALMNGLKDKEKLKAALRIMATLISYNQMIPRNYGFASNPNNTLEAIRLVLAVVFGVSANVRFDSLGSDLDDCFFTGGGSKKASEKLGKLKSSIEPKFDKDAVNEVAVMQTVLNRLAWKGAVLTFAGSTKLYKDDSNDTEAEFDGLIFTPTYDPRKMFGIIVEAKNQNHGQTSAKKQLKKRLADLCNPLVDYSTIESVDRKGTYAVLKLI